MAAAGFWRPGSTQPSRHGDASGFGAGVASSLDRDADRDVVLGTLPASSRLTLEQQRLRLPIADARLQILYLVESYPTVVIVGHTGCGKTTQIPQFLYEAGWTAQNRCIACSQPRRVAATSVAARVAEEMSVPLGSKVGYSVRFDDCSDASTAIKYLTDGMLLREMMMDPLLLRYTVVMVDEAHERSLNTDLLLGLLKKIQRRRGDLRIIVASATIDAAAFKRFFNTNTSGDASLDSACIMSVEGRLYPVAVHYAVRPAADYIAAAVDTVLAIHATQPQGDVLLFLTGQDEIDSAVEFIRQGAKKPSGGNAALQLVVLPLYAGLPHDQQMKVFERAGPRTRKVVVATNIAETSVTIDGICYVVDPGFVKMRVYHPVSHTEGLVIRPVSKSSACQRAGRAGRVRAGHCYRLYTEASFDTLPDNPVPEIQRNNLSAAVLQLKALGIDNILAFDFIDVPACLGCVPRGAADRQGLHARRLRRGPAVAARAGAAFLRVQTLWRCQSARACGKTLENRFRVSPGPLQEPRHGVRPEALTVHVQFAPVVEG